MKREAERVAAEATALELDGELGEKLARVRAELLDEYRQPHAHPWIIGYSGGKDSTLVVQLVLELLLELPRSERVRPVHIVANDTLVESPLVMAHIIRTMERFREATAVLRLPIEVSLTRPDPEQTFWVNLIGRGYPSPSRSFRWCTDRMKILPTSRYIRAQASSTGHVILLLGVRREESAARAARVDRYTREAKGSRLSPHNDLQGCLVFRPIVDLTTDEVWEFLGSVRPPWGGTHQDLIQLYRHAQGGECPVVTQRDDAPSCGTSSSRFGCWTCTVVVKDRSLEGFIEAGFTEFGPLLAFRDWLASVRDQPGRRMVRRRNGTITHLASGELVPGPFTVETRHEILDRLLQLQQEVGRELISRGEIDVIRKTWAEEMAAHAERVLASADLRAG
jgi:DNA sulfur modification protein DndC